MRDANTVLTAMSECPATRFWRVAFEDLAMPERVFRCVWELESQLGQGDLETYYRSPAADQASFAPEALRLVNATRTADIVAEANRVFPAGGPPPNAAARRAALEGIAAEERQQLERLTTRFTRVPEDVTELLYHYVVRNRRTITGVEFVDGL